MTDESSKRVVADSIVACAGDLGALVDVHTHAVLVGEPVDTDTVVASVTVGALREAGTFGVFVFTLVNVDTDKVFFNQRQPSGTFTFNIVARVVDTVPTATEFIYNVTGTADAFAKFDFIVARWTCLAWSAPSLSHIARAATCFFRSLEG